MCWLRNVNKMISLVGALCFVNIFLISNGNGYLMVDKLRWDFLNLEENLWKYVLEQSKNGFNDTDDPGVIVISGFATFDNDLQKVVLIHFSHLFSGAYSYFPLILSITVEGVAKLA